MISLRSRVLRLAFSDPTLKKPLLEAHLRTAREVKGPGGMLFDFERGFSLRTWPSDPPYNQTYQGLILMESGPKRPYREALKVIAEFKDEIMRFRKPYDVRQFVNEKVEERMGKTPKWHSYYMPD